MNGMMPFLLEIQGLWDIANHPVFGLKQPDERVQFICLLSDRRRLRPTTEPALLTRIFRFFERIPLCVSICWIAGRSSYGDRSNRALSRRPQPRNPS